MLRQKFYKYETVILDKDFANSSYVTVVSQTSGLLYTEVTDGTTGWDTMTNRLTRINKMEREKVYEAIDTEREYQERETINPDRPDMIEDFNMGTALQALNVMLNKTGEVWYTESPEDNYEGTMNMLRKIAGVCTQMGEKYGMPKRDLK